MNTSQTASAALDSVAPAGAPRFQRADRQRIETYRLSLNELLPDDHRVRIVWDYVESLDLTALYDQIQAREHGPGRSPIDPRILVALWLWAVLDGVNSARRLARLCQEHLAYRWLCGHVRVNYHTLAAFRVAAQDVLDDLLTQSVAALLYEGLVSLDRVAQDGMRVRASAGSSSFRRKPTLEQCLTEAQTALAALEQEDASAQNRRQQAARERAVRERAERIQHALDALPELEQKLDQRKKGRSERARASTTDPEARRMKMADGGFRAAYNVQLVTTTESRVVVGVEVTNVGGDAGLIKPMLDQVEARYQQRPRELLGDGGYSTAPDIDAVEAAGTTVYVPVREVEKLRARGENPFAAREGDSPNVGAWRERMGTAAAQTIYRERAGTAEFPNAGCRNRGLTQFLVRSLGKVKATALWHALAHNFHRTLALRAAAQPAGN